MKVVNWSEFHFSEMTLLQNPYFNREVRKFKESKKGINCTYSSEIRLRVSTLFNFLKSSLDMFLILTSLMDSHLMESDG